MSLPIHLFYFLWVHQKIGVLKKIFDKKTDLFSFMSSFHSIFK